MKAPFSNLTHLKEADELRKARLQKVWSIAGRGNLKQTGKNSAAVICSAFQ